jgi:predicted phage tail protein
MTRIYGAGGGGGGGGGKGGGGGGGGGGDSPEVQKDNLESTQYARVIDLISEGEIEGLVGGAKGVFFDNTPLQADNGSFNFADVQYHTRNGTQNQDPIPLGDSVEDEVAVGVLFDTEDQIAIRQITDVNVDAVRITIQISALLRVEEDGDQRGGQIELTVEIQYDGGGYSEVIRDDIRGRTTNPYQRDYIINFTQSFNTAVDIKMRRVSESAASYQSKRDLLQYANDFSWVSYTEIIRAKLAYPNSALFGARINAAQFNRIPARKYRIRGIKVKIPSNATVDNTNGRLIYSGVWDGTFGAAAWTTDPAWILWDLLTSTRYGFGDQLLTDAEKTNFTGNASRLDKFSFYSASQYCSELVEDGFGSQEPRFSCNVNIQTAEEAFKLINDMSSVFRAMPYWASGALTISQDRPADAAYAFTLANVTPEGFTYQSSSRRNRPTVVIVSYLDLQLRDIAYEAVEDEELIAKWGVVKKEISAFACTSRGQANRIGRWLLYSERYESETVTFTTSLDAGVVVRPGQIIKISDPLRSDLRRGGRIVSATTTAITVDDASGIPTASVNRQMNVVMPDGTLEQRTVSDVTGSVVTVADPFSVAPNANSVWVLGTNDIQTSLWRVVGIQEENEVNYTVAAVSYNQSKYAYVEQGVTLIPRDITNLNEAVPAPSALQFEEVLYAVNGIAKAKLIIDWNNVPSAEQYRFQWREENGNWTTRFLTSPGFELVDYKAGLYEFQVWSVNVAQILGPNPASATYFAQAKTAKPEDVTGLSLVSNSESTAILSWDRATALDVILGGKVLIRHTNAIEDAAWDKSQSIVAAAAGGQTQKIVPLLEGTYLVKFEDDTGNRSENAATFVVDFPEPQSRLLVETYREDQDYLTFVDDLGTWDSLGPIDTISTTKFGGTGTNMSYDSGLDGLILDDTSLQTGEYEFDRVIDLGAVFDMNIKRHLVTRGYLASSTLWDNRTGDIDSWSTIDVSDDLVDYTDAIMYVRATPDDPGSSPTWGVWREFTNAIVRGRAFQFKVKAIAEVESENIIIDELGATFQLQQRTEALGPLETTAGSITDVSFESPFYAPPVVTVVGYNSNPSATVSVFNVTRNNFKVEFQYNGVIEGHAFNYVAVGYGKEIT